MLLKLVGSQMYLFSACRFTSDVTAAETDPVTARRVNGGSGYVRGARRYLKSLEGDKAVGSIDRQIEADSS